MRWSYQFGLCLGLDLAIAVVMLCVLFIALEPRAEAGIGACDGEGVAFASGVDIEVAMGQKNEIRIVRPTRGARISGKMHIKLKVGKNIKKVFVFVDDKYFASGAPQPILWNSASVSNGPHRITVAAATPALTSDALFLGSQSQDTTNFFVRNKPKVSLTLTATPTPLGGITPPTLINKQTFVAGAVFGGHMVHGDGITDDSAAMQAAVNAGDVYVQSGNYAILNQVTISTNGRNIQCQCNTPSGVCTAAIDSNGIITNTISGISTYFVNTATSTWNMFSIGSANNTSIFYCGFKGVNYNATARTLGTTGFNQFVTMAGWAGATANNTRLIGNDFNGVPGMIAAVLVHGNMSPNDQPPPSGTVISWNTFQHCGYYGIQVDASQSPGTTISYNRFNDCSGMVEGNVTTPKATADTDLLIDHNHLTFTYGIGAAETNCGSLLGFCGLQGLTGGSNASGAPFDYSGNTVSNNTVDCQSLASATGNGQCTIQETANCSGIGTPPACNATYTNDTCTGNCVIK